MGYAQSYHERVPGTPYTIVVDTSKANCQETEHCHVDSSHGDRIDIDSGTPYFRGARSYVERRYENDVLDFVQRHISEIRRVYDNNRHYGSD